jgi:poly [ADP-ribose] polymerase
VYTYFIKVSDENNNKFYEMKEDPSGDTFTATYGRVDSTSTTRTYSMGEWHKVYSTRVKHGYKDVTDLRATESVSVANSFVGRSADALRTLMAAASGSISRNYTSSGATQAMIDAAQALVDGIVASESVNEANKLFVELYTTIPRKMRNVRDNLACTTDDVKSMVSYEQDLLNQLSAQVQVTSAAEVPFVLEDCSMSTIVKDMGYGRVDFHPSAVAYKVTFENPFEKVGNEKLLWHGSRIENWIHILSQGLRIHPASAIRTGSAFGQGIYFADVFSKSYGYTSGASRFLGVYEVSLGNMVKKAWGDNECYRLNWERLRQWGDYHSLMGDASLGRLNNNEYVIYRENQCRIKYLVEV